MELFAFRVSELPTVVETGTVHSFLPPSPGSAPAARRRNAQLASSVDCLVFCVRSIGRSAHEWLVAGHNVPSETRPTGTLV